MQTSTPIIDLHVHSTLKPYGNSYYPNTNIKLTTNSACIWFSDKFSSIDTVYEGVAGIPRYRQSDFTTLVEGQVQIVCVSLYPTEKQFVEITSIIFKPFEDWIANFVSLFGRERIKYIQGSDYNYFQDLLKEYDFLLCLNNINPTDSSKSYSVIPNGNNLSQISNLLVITTIEGCHVFCDGHDTRNLINWNNLESNISKVKSWESPPFFVTFAHHFFNGLCTHAKSLFNKPLDQSYGMRDYNYSPTDTEKPITDIGYVALKSLLSKQNGKRILIDVKHMSLEARNKYYEFLKTPEYINEKIPVIWSHGALNESEPFEINMNFDDVAIIYNTNGIIGIEIDQRILGYNQNRFWKTLGNLLILRNKDEKIAYREAEYFWNQIIKIAEYAYSIGFTDDPWRSIALGSDYDGIINPLNSYRDATSLSVLYQNLIFYLKDYWSKGNSKIPKTTMDEYDVIYRVMYKNAHDFISKNYL